MELSGPLRPIIRAIGKLAKFKPVAAYGVGVAVIAVAILILIALGLIC